MYRSKMRREKKKFTDVRARSGEGSRGGGEEE